MQQRQGWGGDSHLELLQEHMQPYVIILTIYIPLHYNHLQMSAEIRRSLLGSVRATGSRDAQPQRGVPQNSRTVFKWVMLVSYQSPLHHLTWLRTCPHLRRYIFQGSESFSWTRAFTVLPRYCVASPEAPRGLPSASTFKPRRLPRLGLVWDICGEKEGAVC